MLVTGDFNVVRGCEGTASYGNAGTRSINPAAGLAIVGAGDGQFDKVVIDIVEFDTELKTVGGPDAVVDGGLHVNIINDDRSQMQRPIIIGEPRTGRQVARTVPVHFRQWFGRVEVVDVPLGFQPDGSRAQGIRFVIAHDRQRDGQGHNQIHLLPVIRKREIEPEGECEG